MERVILFGAGAVGRKAVKYFGSRNVVCFVDNNPDLWGTLVENILVISLEAYLSGKIGGEIIICTQWKHVADITKQLRDNKISNYKVFHTGFFEELDLVTYDYMGKTEEIWNDQLLNGNENLYIRNFVEENKNNVPIFHEVEIETINRCNGSCAFCPVNSKIDSRKISIMDKDLFEKIILQLEDLDYAGRIALFSNNEPLLDKRILELHKFAREHLPKAQFHLFTNGTLLTIPIFKELMLYLDELIIDNYNENLELNANIQEIKHYIESTNDLFLRRKVKILLRKPTEILTSRGGEAPNRHNVVNVSKETCALPFTQLVIRPDGKVSLCCNDPLGKVTMGDLRKESVLEIWYGKRYQDLREKLIEGRGNIEKCSGCDTFMII